MDKQVWEQKIKEYLGDYIRYDVPPSTMSHEWNTRYRPWNGIGIAQLPEQIELLLETLESFHIGTFIELGVWTGGLTLLMLDRREAFPGFIYWGIELNSGWVSPRVINLPEIILGDVFDIEMQEKIKYVIDISFEPTMIFCDDGDKPKEMKTYAPLIKVGDYLMAHDYPGEINEISLDEFEKELSNFVEIERTKYRDCGYSLWRKI